MTAWPKSIAEAKKFIQENNQVQINELFTALVTECLGFTGCGPDGTRVIPYLGQNGAECLDNGKINYSYHHYANELQQGDIRQLCPDIDFSKQADDCNS
jgi:hypothetical protein